jgi:hypothetical protein
VRRRSPGRSRSGACGRCGGRDCGVEGGDDLSDLHLGARRDAQRDAAGDLGGAFGRDLVRLQLEKRLILADRVAIGDVPLGEDAGTDGFAQRRDLDFDESHDGEGKIDGADG